MPYSESSYKKNLDNCKMQMNIFNVPYISWKMQNCDRFFVKGASHYAKALKKAAIVNVKDLIAA
jgi:hypothetical protein